MQYPTTFTLPNIPNNVTVQTLLQTLQQQAKKSQQPFQIQLATLQQQIQQQQLQQQETPDSSSQDIVLNIEPSNNTSIKLEESKILSKKRPMTNKKLPTNSEIDEPSKKTQKLSIEALPTNHQEDKTEKSVENNKTNTESKKKVCRKLLNKPVVENEVKTTSANKKSNDEDLKKIFDLESQLTKQQKQLNAEKNKFNMQKKKLEKVQNDLEKSLDAIQIVQIDLSCQKADNNNLISENIALK